MFNISISTIAWQPSENKKAYLILKDLGIKFLEITPSYIIDRQYTHKHKSYLPDLEKHGLKPIAMQALLFGRPELVIFRDEEARRKTLKYILDLIDIASSLGIEMMVFGSPKNKHTGSLNNKEINNIALDFFGTVGDYAAKNGVVFCIEPTPIEYGANFICNTNEAVEFVKFVGSKGLKVNIDLGSMIMNKENINESIKKAVPVAGHFHISFPKLARIECDEEFHQSIADSIRSTSYSDYLSIEMLGNKKNNTRDLEGILKMAKKIYG